MKTKLAILALLAVAVGGCKEKPSNMSSVNVYLTDAPAAGFDSVVVDIKGLDVVSTSGTMYPMNMSEAEYNLLDLSNGANIFIATAQISPATVSEVLLVLGNNNYVVQSGTKYRLNMPASDTPGLAIPINSTLTEGAAFKVLLDFDANRSIVPTQTGGFYLTPVIRLVNASITGSVTGELPATAFLSVVAATNGASTYTTSVNMQGNFLLQGVPAGDYTVTITSYLPFQVVTFNNVMVTNGQVTNINNTSSGGQATGIGETQ